MADIVTTKSTLQNVFRFTDGDTRSLNIDDPHSSVTTADVQAWAAYAKEHNLLIGDKAGAALDDIISSKIVDSTKTIVDLTIV